MDKAEARRFLEKYAAGNYTAAEHRAFHQWILSQPLAETEALLREYSSLLQQDEKHISADPQLLKRIEKRLYDEPPTVKLVPVIRRNRKKLLHTAAAVIILIVISGVYRIWESQHQTVLVVMSPPDLKSGISPGGDKAVLTLADGSRIALDEVSQGMLARQGHTRLVKLNNGELTYEPEGGETGSTSSKALYNTVETPRGGQFQIVLPDGSQVWLNAASSLRFPTVFKGSERWVELEGEAYFEISRDEKRPFKVKTGDMEVEVLGTHFNIKAYKDEKDVQTTLLEGSVKINTEQKQVLLLPGEEASLQKKNGSISVTKQDAQAAIAWKNGYFQFDSEHLHSIMRKISRWYDVDIVYETDFTDKNFTGTISRYKQVKDVLNMLELTEVIHFRVEGRRIIVMP